MNQSIGILRIFTKWALLECDDTIGAMYRSLYSLEYFYKPRINKPLWGSHVSIIRGEALLDTKVKDELNNLSIEYVYIPEMRTNGVHFWLPVICPILDTIRLEFGLPRSVVNYHLSIGNILQGSNELMEPETFI
jgi:hypothetical protein